MTHSLYLTITLGLILFCLATVAEKGTAQSTTSTFQSQEADNWYFGSRAGIRFLETGPVPLTDGAMSQHEGSAVASDPHTGALFLYTNGTTVWNRQHRVMPNGSGLLGHATSSQTALVVPDPGNSQLLYIFTVGAGDYVRNNNNGLRYSIVDMQQDLGNGDVTAKNRLLSDSTTEKLTATRHCNGRDYWVIAHRYGIFGQQFLSYPVTPLGVGAPVSSNIGTPHLNGTDIQGAFKFSPDGATLAVSSSGPQKLELFRFDRETGALSDARTIDSGRNFYGLEFSADSRFLYATTLPPATGTSPLFQYDISSTSTAEIRSSRTQLFESRRTWAGSQLQMGPDGRIYVSYFGRNHLGVIENPEAPGLAADYRHDGFFLDGASTQYGLPNFIQANLFFERSSDATDSLSNYPCSVSSDTTAPLPCPEFDTIAIATGDFAASATGGAVDVLPMVLESSSRKGVSHITVSIEFNEQILLPAPITEERMTLGTALAGWTLVSTSRDWGKISMEFQIAQPLPLTPGSPLLRMPFEGFLGFNGDSSSALLTSVRVLGDSCIRTTSIPGALQVTLCGLSYRLMDLATSRVVTSVSWSGNEQAVMVSLESSAEEPLMVQVFDVGGRLLAKHRQLVTEGPNNFPIPFSSLSKGTHVCQVTRQGTTETVLFLVL